MDAKNQEAALGLYLGIMEEAKTRIGAIDAARLGRLGLPRPLDYEICFLQFRMLCELMALGCLIAHGDIRETKSKRLREAWSSTEIMGALDRLHSKFYPVPYLLESQVPKRQNYKPKKQGF